MKVKIKQRIKQIQQGEIPKGYKRTKLGIVPLDWEIHTLSEHLTESRIPGTNGAVAKKLTVKLWNKGVFEKQEIHKGSESTTYYKRKSGQLIYSKLDFLNCAFGIIPEQLDGYESTQDMPCFDIKDIDPHYLLTYVTQRNFYTHFGMIADGGRKARRVGPEDMLSFPIVCPNLAEQQKIAEILSTQDKLIELNHRKIEELKKLKEYYLRKMFPQKGSNVPEIRFKGFTDDWEQRKLGEISSSCSGGTPTVGVKEYYGGKIPFIRSAEINSECTELFITEEGLKNSSARLVSEGDILYALYGATSGEVSRARIKGAINQAILVIKPMPDYDPEYIVQWLQKSKQSITETYLQGGQGNLSGAIVKELMIEFPSLEEQQTIGEYFHNLDRLITLHQHKCEELKKQKKSLIQLLSTGIVRVKT